MQSDYDATEFVDDDFQAATKAAQVTSPSQTTYITSNVSTDTTHGETEPIAIDTSMNTPGNRAPSREEVDSRVSETQQKLAELKRIQEELERERATLEETRRRQTEFQTGRRETLQSLTRDIGLLTEAEFASRRDAEQMSKTLVDLQTALVKVESTSEQGWTKDNFTTELTRALTVIENARMEHNSALQKFTILNGESVTPDKNTRNQSGGPSGFHLGGHGLEQQSLGQLCKLGLALTWPLALVALIVGMLLVLVVRH
jgi:hypothetical protein